MSKLAQLLGRLGGGAEPGALLAPMSGLTDLGMRLAAQSYGASLVISEMVDGNFFTRRDREAQLKAAGDGIVTHVVQIAGCRPDVMAEAARMAEGQGASMIDINMGCPAKKVVGGLAGSSLMRDLDHATTLIAATVNAVSIPVSVKMRLGWDDASHNAPELARRAEKEGAVMVTVHGRTRCQFYKGTADWRAIRRVAQAVTIPVVANGDCGSLDDARAMLAASGAAAVMVGRAAVGRPWLVGDITHALRGGGPRPAPSNTQRRETAMAHYTSILSQHGRERGLRHARKHLAGYATHAGHPPGSPMHQALVTEDNVEAVFRTLARVFEGPCLKVAA